jgi:hypothetical protein
VFCLRPPSPPRFLFGVVKQFSESGQIQSVKLLQKKENMVFNRTPYSPPPPPPNTLYTHIQHTYSHWEGGKGGRVEPERRVRGASVHKAVSKIPTLLNVFPVYTL